MAKRRYSKKGMGSRRSTRGKKSRHTKRHSGRRHHHTRRRVRRGGASNPGAPEIVWPLKPNQLLPGVQPYQRGGSTTVCQNGGVQQPTGSCMNVTSPGGQMKVYNPAGGRA